jgi:transposase
MNPTKVIKHVSADTLKHLIRKEKDLRMHERLLFIQQLYLGDSLEEACRRVCISQRTGRTWLKKWNEKGYEDIKPSFGGGRPPKLSKQQKAELKEKLGGKLWLTHEVRALIVQDYSVKYSERQVQRILRDFRMNYAKPYPHDYRRPNNAEELLSKSLEETLDGIGDHFTLGFMDQSSPQTTDNKQRFWFFGKPTIAKNTEKYRANTYGFYPINGGKEVVEFMESSKKEDICEFLRFIRNKNPAGPVVIVLDRLPSHRSKFTRRFAESLGIRLVFLPPYSPDLNPIEIIWKSIRRFVSRIFPTSEWSFKEAIRTAFHRLAKMPSFAEGWLKTFQPVLGN